MRESAAKAYDAGELKQELKRVGTEREKPTLESVQAEVRGMNEKEKAKVWRATIELETVALDRTQEMFKKELDDLRDQLGQSRERNSAVVNRFRKLNVIIADNEERLKVLEHVAGLYDEAEWSQKIAEAKGQPDVTDEQWQDIEAQAREYVARRAEGESLAWEDIERESREFATKREEAEAA